MSACCGNVMACADLARLEKQIQSHEKEVYAALLKQDKRIADLACQFNGNIQLAISEYLRLLDAEGEFSKMISDTLLIDLHLIDKRTSHIVNVKEYGAAGNGVNNDAAAIRAALKNMEPGDTLYFPSGTYLILGEIDVNKPNITLSGAGLLLCDYGFRIKNSNFKAIGLRLEALSYSTECRAFMMDNSKPDPAGPAILENLVFKDCHFKNFFYSVCAIGGSYSYDGTEAAAGYPVRDLVIENCHSVTYTDNNAGHFQSIQVENIAYINNRTYGGKNASSYNAIKGNGYIRVIGNYDHNNSYASCEIENGSGKAVIANNTFNSKIWVDDSHDVIVNANTTEGGIHVTVGSNNGDAENVVVSNNACKNIRCEQFGTYAGGIIKNVNIAGNNVNGDNTHGIWIHGNAVQFAAVSGNIISGSNTNDIAIQRHEQLDAYVHNNCGNGKMLLVAGTGGRVMLVDNYKFQYSGTREPLEASHLERSFNGLKVTDSSGTAWRINVGTDGNVQTVKYQ